jgi:pyrimidine operon attenuation protein / uracil phosphoribosyltransferase
LHKEQISLKLERMALEIAERNVDAGRIVLAGIVPNGVIMNRYLRGFLAECFEGRIEEISVSLNKRHPEEVIVEGNAPIDDAVLVLVDDVANSGKTLTYALKPFLEHHPVSVQTLVLVARTHKKFPIQPDYVGFSLATTLQEYIDVEVENGEITGAWVE